jgi:hypothetical protein
VARLDLLGQFDLQIGGGGSVVTEAIKVVPYSLACQKLPSYSPFQKHVAYDLTVKDVLIKSQRSSRDLILFYVYSAFFLFSCLPSA